MYMNAIRRLARTVRSCEIAHCLAASVGSIIGKNAELLSVHGVGVGRWHDSIPSQLLFQTGMTWGAESLHPQLSAYPQTKELGEPTWHLLLGVLALRYSGKAAELTIASPAPRTPKSRFSGPGEPAQAPPPSRQGARRPCIIVRPRNWRPGVCRAS